MDKKSFCIANWKMNKNISECIEYLETFNSFDLSVSNSEIIISPSFLYLNTLIKENCNPNRINFSAQNVFNEERGSFTGEVSIEMLESIKCKWVIIGHSERRVIMGETESDISKKMHLVYISNLTPILCIGETFKEKENIPYPLLLDTEENNQTEKVLNSQIFTAFEKIDFTKNKTVLIAYEPIWAIGTGLAADRNTIEKNIGIIKNIINNINIKNCNISLLYGGSVDEYNADEIFSIPDIKGFLIGSSSLDAQRFYNIYKQI